MGITIFGRGVPISAVSDDATLNVAWLGTAVLDITTGGISANLLQSATICGNVAASAVNLAGVTFTGGGSATISAGNAQAISADKFLKIAIGGKSYYIPAFASAGALSAA